MKKKFIGFLLMGAFIVSSTSMFVSCSDYDNDIADLRNQIAANAQTAADGIAQAKALYNQGIVITNVAQDGSGVKLTFSDGQTLTIKNGENGVDGANGKDADVWTIGADNFWYKNGEKTQYKAVGQDGAKGEKGDKGDTGAQGEKGEKGDTGATGAKGDKGDKGEQGEPGAPAMAETVVYIVPDSDGFFYAISANGVKSSEPLFAWNSTISGDAQIAAVQTATQVFFANALAQGRVDAIPTTFMLSSLVFIPDTYYWGIEATTIKTIKVRPYPEVMELDSYIKYPVATITNAAGDILVATDSIDHINDSYEWIGSEYDPFEMYIDYTTPWAAPAIYDPINFSYIMGGHSRYHHSLYTTVIQLNPRARYHINPSRADLSNTQLSILDNDVAYTRASIAGITVRNDKDGNPAWYRQNDSDTLIVPLQVNDPDLLGSVKSLFAKNADDAVTNFALQARFTNAEGVDTTITSDYAVLIQDSIYNPIIAHKRWHTTGILDTDYTETGLLNDHCGFCNLPARGEYEPYHNEGMHLFRTTNETKEAIINTMRVDATLRGEGQYLVQWDRDLCLNDLIETHFDTSGFKHDVFTEDEFNANFYYTFDLTSMLLGNNLTDESAHAALYKGEDGKTYLHPQDPDASTNGLKGLPYSKDNKVTEVVVNRVPVVRVELHLNINDSIVDYGYIPVRIVKEIIPPTVYITHTYTSPEDWSINRYNECYVGSKPFEAFRSNWRQTEEDLMSHVELGQILDAESFENYYKAVGPLTLLDQFEAYKDEEGKWRFEPCDGNYQEVSSKPVAERPWKIGNMVYNKVNAGQAGTETSTLLWNVDKAEIEALSMLAEGRDTIVYRAMKLKSQTNTLPDIYVIFESGNIHINEISVVADAHLKEKIIAQYWYETDKNDGGKGTDEIHAIVYTPQEKLNVGADIDHQGTSQNTSTPTYLNGIQAYKPLELQMKFSNVFYGNFNLVTNPSTSEITNTMPHSWLTFDYKDKDGNVVADVDEDDAEVFDAQKLNLDFLIDVDNSNKHFKGDLKDAKGTTFILWVNENDYTITFNKADGTTENRTFKPGRVLMARKLNPDVENDSVYSDYEPDLQLVAYLEPKGTDVMDYLDTYAVAGQYLIKLNNNVVTNQDNRYAKALLNYRAYNKMAEGDFLSVKISLLAIDAAGNAYGDVLPVYDGTGTLLRYCELPIINNHFNVRFIRPITIEGTLAKEITDANTGTATAQIVDIGSVLSAASFKDFRNSWAASPKYMQYFAPDGEEKIVLNVEGVTSIGQHLSDNPDVLTDISYATSDPNYGKKEKGLPLYQVSSELDLVLTSYNLTTGDIKYEYRNNSATVGTFHIWIPITIDYYWGTIYDYFTLTVKRTPGN